MSTYIESEDPLDSSNPDVVKAENSKMMQFMQDEMRRDRETAQQKTIAALTGIRAPVMVGGASAGGIANT